MKKILIIISCIIAAILLTAAAGLLKSLFMPPAPQLPESAEILPSVQTAPGTEAEYRFQMTLPADWQIKNVKLMHKERETAAGDFKFDSWKFDRLKWNINGTFPVLETGEIGDLSILVTAEKFFGDETAQYSVPLPILHSTLPDSVKPGGELLLAPIPDAGELDGISGENPSTAFYKHWAFYLIIALVILIIVLIFLFKKRKIQAERVPLDTKTLREIQQICDLVKEKQISPENGFARLSDVVRNYLEARSGLPASRRTTEEFLQELSAGLPFFSADERIYLTGFLNSADLIKFAGANAGEKMLDNAAAQAGELVRSTTRAAEEKENGK